MDKVIQFPKADACTRALDEHETTLDKMYMGAFSFTCPCNNTSVFEPKNMIFRTLEFYCSQCGVPHKLVNPSFALPKITKAR